MFVYRDIDLGLYTVFQNLKHPFEVTQGFYKTVLSQIHHYECLAKCSPNWTTIFKGAFQIFSFKYIYVTIGENTWYSLASIFVPID